MNNHLKRMMTSRLGIAVVLLLLPLGIKAQRVTDDDTKIYAHVEQMPKFPGGDLALMNYLKESVRYPFYAQENNIQGKVTVSFVVEKDGSITNVKVVRSVHSSLDKEAIRVISSMPKWQPARQNKKPVRVTYMLPVSFRLP